jgi:hypothetical protein
MKTNGLVYHEDEEGFTGIHGCFQMLASYELNEFCRATSTKTKMADGTGNATRAYGTELFSNGYGGCFQSLFVVEIGCRLGRRYTRDRAPLDLTGNDEENKKRVHDLERLATEQRSEINKLKKVSAALELLIFHIQYVLYIM